MFSDLAVLYLFSGGAGAGAVMVCCLLDLLLVKRPFGLAEGEGRGIHEPGPSANALPCALDYAFAAGFALLAFGAVCLMADLGRFDRVAALFLSPHPTVLTVGAYALAVMLVCAAFLAAVRFLYVPDVSCMLVRGVEVAAVVVALVVMAYTGVLLQSLTGVAFWRTPLVPVLFVLSSLSCGVAAVCVSSVFVGVASEGLLRMLRVLARADAAIIVLELAIAMAFLWQMGASAHPGAAASFAELTQGDAAFAWWAGFCFCGMVVPLLVELFCAVRLAAGFQLRKTLAVAAALVLMGALCMRWSLAEVGTQRELELEPVETLLEFDGEALELKLEG